MPRKCFVLMPFRRPFDSYYTDLIAPAIRDAGYTPLRADEIYGTRPVVDDIYREISDSSALVADVTGKNPNVNYELGVAHALRKPVVIISQRHDDIPFDYRHIRTIEYDTSAVTWQVALAGKITNTLRAVDNGGADFPDPDTDFFPAPLDLARFLANARDARIMLAGGDCFYRRLYEALHMPNVYRSTRRPDLNILLRRSSGAATRSSAQFQHLEQIFDMRITIRWYDWDFMLRGYCFDSADALISYFVRTRSPTGEETLTGRYNRMARVSYGRSALDDFLISVFINTFEAFFTRRDAETFEMPAPSFVKEP